MKIIKTQGINYIELLAENSVWYCGTDYSCGDLYEAEEVFLENGLVHPNRVIFINNLDGRLVEPIILEDNQYFGRPTQIDGIIYMLIVDFAKKLIRIVDCGEAFEQLVTKVEIPMSDVKDCYNLLLRGNPLMLTRQGGENDFEVIWPEKISLNIGANEAFVYRCEEDMVFSRWIEDPDYREEIVVRNKVGEIKKIIPGNLFIAPNGEKWILQ